MRNLISDQISEAFARSASEGRNPRARELFVSLARHLHSFARETGLTHAEWQAGLDGLVRAAAIKSRNELVLLSDMFGLSALVDMQNTPSGATSSSALGPFHVSGAPLLEHGGDLWRGQPGEPIVVLGNVRDGVSQRPIADAKLEIWQNADNGLYAAADPNQPPMNYQASLVSDAKGQFCFTTTRWRPYTVPDDGPAGEVLRSLGREAWRPAHLHLIVQTAEYLPVVTEFFFSDDPYLDRDAAFGVRADLIVELSSTMDRKQVPEEIKVRDRLELPIAIANITISLVAATRSGAVGNS